MTDVLKSGCNEAFEEWVKDHNQAKIKWIGHSYANAYMAAQWEGFKAAYYMHPSKQLIEQLQAKIDELEDRIYDMGMDYKESMDRI